MKKEAENKVKLGNQKKTIKAKLADGMNQTIQSLGITKTNKKVSKVLESGAKKVAGVVSKQLKKKAKKEKKENIKMGESTSK